MTFWHWLEEQTTTWQGRIGIGLSAVASIGTIFVTLRKCIALLTAAHQGGLFMLNIEEHIDKMKRELMDRLDRIDEGQQNIIQARRAVMEEDELKAWFETDTGGRFVWANRLWRTLTGMDSDNVRGHGWEIGIDQEEREEVMKDWRSAFDHQRLFERSVTLMDSHRGTRTRVRLTAWPMRSDKDSKILSYLGYCSIQPHERRRQS